MLTLFSSKIIKLLVKSIIILYYIIYVQTIIATQLIRRRHTTTLIESRKYNHKYNLRNCKKKGRDNGLPL